MEISLYQFKNSDTSLLLILAIVSPYQLCRNYEAFYQGVQSEDKIAINQAVTEFAENHADRDFAHTRENSPP